MATISIGNLIKQKQASAGSNPETGAIPAGGALLPGLFKTVDPSAKPKVAMYLNRDDEQHIGYFRQLFRDKFLGGVATFVPAVTLAQVKQVCAANGISKVITTQKTLLAKLIRETGTTTNADGDDVSVHNFAGSLFTWEGIEFLILPPLKGLRFFPLDKPKFTRWLEKLHSPEKFHPTVPFSWEEAVPHRFDELLRMAKGAILCGVDAETIQEGLYAYIWGFGLLIQHEGQLKIHVVVVHIDSYDKWEFARQMIQTSVPKVMQNGHYDCSYAMRFNMPPMNYIYDTYGLAHSFYAELPRSLAFLSSFWIRESVFWKEERKSQTFVGKMLYNAKDCYNTVMVLLNMCMGDEIQDWVGVNYGKSFKLLYPSLNSDLFGLKIDLDERKKQADKYYESLCSRRDQLRQWLGLPGFNPGSPDQVSKLYSLMSKGRIKGTDKLETQKFIELGPLHKLIGETIRAYRKDVKALGTYFEFELLDGRLIYKIDPFGTDTGRLASQSSDFWCGTQIQNIPAYAKSMVVADDGWEISEIDNEQSESRTTAYLAQDENLIKVVETSPDFHCTNCSLFFGIPFEQLYDVVEKKPLNKAIRTIGKRVNHGANYNMGPGVLEETMGTREVYKARELLGWPSVYTARTVCSLLLSRFDRTYPRVRNQFQDEIRQEISTTGRLVLPGGWTRICHSWTTGTKEELNSYIAHKPQGLSVQLVNEGWYRAWKKHQYEAYLETGAPRIRFHAQIHDSLMFQHRIGDVEVIQDVSKIMMIPIEVHGRTLVIPNAPKWGAQRWSDLKD